MPPRNFQESSRLQVREHGYGLAERSSPLFSAIFSGFQTVFSRPIAPRYHLKFVCARFADQGKYCRFGA